MQYGHVCAPGVFSPNCVQFIYFHTKTEKTNCKCSIGIGTGLVFAGVVGTSGNRREYSVIGDTVNLAARMMQQACLESEHKIIVCKDTAMDAEVSISFCFLRSQKFKGK
jgi:adenylate cyclase 10